MQNAAVSTRSFTLRKAVINNAPFKPVIQACHVVFLRGGNIYLIQAGSQGESLAAKLCGIALTYIIQ